MLEIRETTVLNVKFMSRETRSNFGVVPLLIIYSPPCHPRCPCLSFFSQKEIKFFDENISGFSPYNGLQWEPNGSRS